MESRIAVMRYLLSFLFVLITFNMNAQDKTVKQSPEKTISNDMMVRISEIEIFPEHLQTYNAILKEEAAISVRVEAGIIAIFPMYQKENNTQIRIIEIYADDQAYKSHLQTPHFKHYKTATAKMVKSLKLVDMESLDKENMRDIFKKM